MHNKDWYVNNIILTMLKIEDKVESPFHKYDRFTEHLFCMAKDNNDIKTLEHIHNRVTDHLSWLTS